MITPELSRTLVKLIDRYPTLIIEDGGISFVSDTSEPPAESIIQTTVDMAGAAQQLVSRRPEPLEKPKPTPPRPTETPPPDPPSGESRQRSPATSVEPPSQQAEAVDKPVAPSPSPMAPAPPPPPPPAPAESGLPDTFFDDVFGDNRLSFEADGEFEERFGGRKVTLSGSVKQAREIDEDTTVTTGPATKAVVTVAQIENDLYGKTAIDAVVFLPSGTADKLQRGEFVTFRGTLATVDPCMRNLFITDARLS